MPDFRYTARNNQGQLVDGVVSATDRANAISQVEQKRFVPIKIQPVSAAAPAEPPALVRLTAP